MAEVTPYVYEFAEFPKVLYLGAKVRTVVGEAAEKAAAKAGWLTHDRRTDAELPPEPVGDGAPVSVSEPE